MNRLPWWFRFLFHFAFVCAICLAYDNCPDLQAVWPLRAFIPTMALVFEAKYRYWVDDRAANYHEQSLGDDISVVVSFSLTVLQIGLGCSTVLFFLTPWVVYVFLLVIIWVLTAGHEVYCYYKGVN